MKKAVLVLVSVLVFAIGAVPVVADADEACNIPPRLEIVNDWEMAGQMMLDLAVKVGFIPTAKILSREYLLLVPGQVPREALPFPFSFMTDGEIAPVKHIAVAETGMYVYLKDGTAIREAFRIRDLLIGMFDEQLQGVPYPQR